MIIFGIALILGGVALLAYNMGTYADGCTQSNIYEARTTTHAFVLWVGSSRYSSYIDWMSPKDIGQVMWTVKAIDPSKELFIGWIEATDDENYLNGISFETPPTWNWYIEAYYVEIEITISLSHNQGAPTRSPTEETFWITSAQSSNPVKITWDAFWKPSTDRKMLIVMNLDGSSNIEADIQLGFKVPIFSWLPFVLIPVGVIFCLAGIVVIRRKDLVKLLKIHKKMPKDRETSHT